MTNHLESVALTGRFAVYPIVRTTPENLSLLAACAGCLFSCRAIFVMVSARWLDLGTEPGVLCSFGISAVLAAAAVLGAIGNRTPSSMGVSTERPLRWVILYIVYLGCSLLWSASVSPASSALYWSGLMSDIVIVILLSRGCGAACAAHSLLKGFISGSLVLAAVAWIIPAAADLRLGDLEYFNTNQIGNLCALAILMCALLNSRGDGKWRTAAAFLGITLFRSLSKATLIAFIASLMYRLLCDSGMSRQRKWMLASSSIIMTMCFWSLLIAYYGVYTTAGNQAETLTGRTAIWTWALDAGMNRAWFGNGFDSMWKVAPPFGIEQFEARHAENELLQQFFAYGVFGVALLAGVYGSLYRQFSSLPRSPQRGILISFLVFVWVRGFAEAEPFDLLLPLWLITALALLVQQQLAVKQEETTQQLCNAADAKGF